MNNRKIKILHFFKKLDYGGAELRTIEVMKKIDRNKYEFHFCVNSPEEGELDELVRKLGGFIHVCELNWRFAFRLRKIIKSHKIDVIHSHLFMFSGVINLIAYYCKVPIRISHFRSSGDGKQKTTLNNIKKKLLQSLLDRFSTDIVAVNMSTMEIVWGDRWKSDPRCKVIYNGIDLSKVKEEISKNKINIKEELSLPKSSNIIIHVGRSSPAKNHFRLLRIFKEITVLEPNSYLILVGDVEEEKLINFINNEGLNDRVIFLGIRKDIFRLFHYSDLMVFPSIREGLPGAVLEAVAVGTPVIASNIKVIKEINEFKSLEFMDLKANDRYIAVLAVKHMKKINAERDFEKSLSFFINTKYNIDNCVREFGFLYDQIEKQVEK